MSEKRKALSVSFQTDTNGESGVVAHNNREFVAKNVDESRIKDNITYKREDLREKYNELFDAAVAEYNAKQKRSDRKITDYYEHIKNSKQEKLFHEIVVCFGNRDTCGLNSGNWEIAKEMCDEYMRDFEKRNPNLKVYNAVLHCDEQTPHLHIDFVPVTYKVKRGPAVKNSMRSALIEQGFSAVSKMQNELTAWEESERNAMTEILLRHNFEREQLNTRRKHLSVDDYKAAMDEINLLNAHINKLKEKSNEEISPQDAEAIRNQNDVMRAKISEQQEQINALVHRYNSPLVKFEVFDQDKLLYIARQLDNLRIQYAEESNALYVPEYVIGECRKFAANYKSIAPSIKDRIRMDIDVLVLSSESLDQLLEKLQERGYEIKHGKYLAVKSPDAERFTRLKTLGADYLPEKLEQRIAERDNLPNSVRESCERTVGVERIFHLEILRTVEAVKNYSYRPQKQWQDELYCFENDTIIENLSRQIMTMVEYDIHSAEKLYSTAESLEKSIAENQSRVKELSDEYSALKEKIERGYMGEELRQRYELLPKYIDSLKAEIQQDRLKLSRLSDVIANFERVSGGGYLANIIAEQNAKKEFENLDLSKEQVVSAEKKDNLKKS